jgi:hypothetical protein
MKTSDSYLARQLGRLFKPAKPDYQVQAEKQERSFYGKAKRLAKKLNVDIETDHTYTNDFPPEVERGYWICMPDEDVPDWLRGEMFSTSWLEVWEKLQQLNDDGYNQ